MLNIKCQLSGSSTTFVFNFRYNVVLFWVITYYWYILLDLFIHLLLLLLILLSCSTTSLHVHKLCRLSSLLLLQKYLLYTVHVGYDLPPPTITPPSPLPRPPPATTAAAAAAASN